MALWNITVTHQDQTTATGRMGLTAPGNGNAVTISLVCSCGYRHTLVGTQSNQGKVSGTGMNSVAPPNDPRSNASPEGDPAIDDVPSWEGSPINPEEEDQPEDEEKGDGEDGAYGEDAPADGR